MDRLTPLAASFLQAEDVDPTASLAIGSIAVFDGPTPDFEEFLAGIRGRLPLIPRYRQRLRQVPFGLAAPAWVDDPGFDLRWHVRSTALPAPGGDEQLASLFSRVMTRRMDRSRPLWEYWFIEGLAGGRWGLLSKLHHSLVDGVSGTDLYQLVLDPTPTPRPALPDTWQPAAPASTAAFTAAATLDLLTSPVQAGAAVTRAVRAPKRLLLTAAASARGLVTLAGAARPVHATSLTGHLDGSRRYAWTRASLSEIAGVRRAHQVSVNDVALAAVSGGFRRLLESRGEGLDPHAVRTLVPVSTRAPGEESIPDNRVSLMLPYLPVDLADPVERLEAVHQRIRALQAEHEPEGGGAVTTLAGFGPFAPIAWGMRLGMRFPQRQIATVTTNVPGPRTTLYALGRELRELLPYVPIADRVRIGVAIFSYRDALIFGLTGDYDTTSDLQVLADGIAASLGELVAVSANA
jgi:diacylglycerol O-acyltransferase